LLVAAFVAALVGLGVAASPALAQGAPTHTPQEKAAAIATPGVVYLTTQWHGWVQLPGGSKWFGPFDAATACTGFVASPDGYIVTAGHCVDSRTMMGGKDVLIRTALDDWLSKNLITQAEAERLLAEEDQWGVEAKQRGAPPDRTVTVYQTVAASSLTGQKGMLANVVEYRQLFQGDVALLKVETSTPMPTLALAPSAPEIGSSVIAIGYPGSVSEVTDPSTAPSVETGTISGERTLNGVPFTEIDAATSHGMSGGPAVNAAGQALGTVSFTPSDEPQSFNFVTSLSTLKALLARNGVGTTLSKTDRTYRAGLQQFWAGHYHAAVRDFNAVLAAAPNHAQAQAYKIKAVALYPQEVKPATKNSSSLLLFLVIGAVVLLAIAAVAFVLTADAEPGPPPQSRHARLRRQVQSQSPCGRPRRQIRKARHGATARTAAQKTPTEQTSAPCVVRVCMRRLRNGRQCLRGRTAGLAVRGGAPAGALRSPRSTRMSCPARAADSVSLWWPLTANALFFTVGGSVLIVSVRRWGVRLLRASDP